MSVPLLRKWFRNKRKKKSRNHEWDQIKVWIPKGEKSHSQCTLTPFFFFNCFLKISESWNSAVAWKDPPMHNKHTNGKVSFDATANKPTDPRTMFFLSGIRWKDALFCFYFINSFLVCSLIWLIWCFVFPSLQQRTRWPNQAMHAGLKQDWPDWLPRCCSATDVNCGDWTHLTECRTLPPMRHGEDLWTAAGISRLVQSHAPGRKCLPRPPATLLHSAPA